MDIIAFSGYFVNVLYAVVSVERQNMKKMKKNEVKVAERIRRGNFLIELKIESGWKGARNAAKRKWNMGHSNVQEHIRVSERFGSDPEQIERIETLDVPFAVLKKLACNYITDEMVDRFFELLESISLPLRTIQNCLPLLDQVKGEFNITNQVQLSGFSEEEDSFEADSIDDVMPTPPETPGFVSFSLPEEQPLSQSILTAVSQGEEQLNMFRLFARSLEILEHRIEILEASGITPIA